MKRSFLSTIRGKLVSRTLLVVMIPLLALGGVAVVALTSLARSADTNVDAARAQLGQDVVGDGGGVGGGGVASGAVFRAG